MLKDAGNWLFHFQSPFKYPPHEVVKNAFLYPFDVVNGYQYRQNVINSLKEANVWHGKTKHDWTGSKLALGDRAVWTTVGAALGGLVPEAIAYMQHAPLHDLTSPVELLAAGAGALVGVVQPEASWGADKRRTARVLKKYNRLHGTNIQNGF